MMEKVVRTIIKKEEVTHNQNHKRLRLENYTKGQVEILIEKTVGSLTRLFDKHFFQ